MSATWLVAEREFAARIRSKGFLVSLVATSLAIVALAVVPTFLDREPSYTVAVVGPGSGPLAEVLPGLGTGAGAEVEVETDRTEQQARDALADEEVDAVVVEGERLLVRPGTDTQLTGLLQTAHQGVQVQQNLDEVGLSPDEAASALAVAPLDTETVGGQGDEQAREGLALVLMICLLLLLMTSALGVAVGIVEEKGSRIVEILMVSVRPWQLLTGKLLAYGVLGLVQLAAFVVCGLGSAAATGLTDDLPRGTVTIAAAAGLGYLLGFVFFASLAAALASLVSRQEEVNGALAPLSTLMMGAYLGAFLALQDPGSTESQVLSMVPPFSALTMPVRYATGDVPQWQVLVAVVAMLVSVVAIVLLGGRTYERSVLRTGSKIRLLDALRG
jgi:ABC-2 type transport system permease protein